MTPKGNATHVLLVESDPGWLEIIDTRLSAATDTFLISHVSQLQQIKGFSASDIDIVLLDLFLPDSRGEATLTRARAAMPSTPIVVLAGSDDEAMDVQAIRNGAHDYLAKGSLTSGDLTRTIRYAIERAHSEELKKLLLHSDRLAAVGQLATGVAHEINNPAAFITANLSVLRDQARTLSEFMPRLQNSVGKDISRDQSRLRLSISTSQMESVLIEMNKVIQENIEGMSRITTIVKDLQIFGRKDPSAVEMVALNQVIDSACNIVFNEIKHRARLVKDLEKLPLIPGHKVNLGQVLVNLLLNAAHAIEGSEAEKNAIKIRTRFEGGQIVLVVEDTGNGIDPEIISRIFDPFFTTKPSGKGTGLGLALCAETIHQHQGTIRVESTPGKGTRFEVILPEDTGLQLPESPPSMPPREHSAQRRLKVLLIDDEEFLLRAFSRTLKTYCEVEVAHGGVEGLAILGQEPSFDVIVCDLMMPEVDGQGVYEYLCEQMPRLAKQVVFCSGGAITQKAKQFIANVPNLMLQKPVDPDVLRRIITQIGISNAA